MNMELTVADSKIAIDSNGFLLKPSDWNKAVALAIAEKEGLKLTDDHWALLLLLRDFYQKYQLIPPLRIFVKTVKAELGSDLGNSISIHKLFPQSPLKLACKVAGLPKPSHCM